MKFDWKKILMIVAKAAVAAGLGAAATNVADNQNNPGLGSIIAGAATAVAYVKKSPVAPPAK